MIDFELVPGDDEINEIFSFLEGDYIRLRNLKKEQEQLRALIKTFETGEQKHDEKVIAKIALLKEEDELLIAMIFLAERIKQIRKEMEDL